MNFKNFTIIAALQIILIAVINFTVLSNNTPGSVVFENEYTATIVGEDGLVIRTDNGGISWITQASNITNVLNSVDVFTFTNQLSGTINVRLVACDNGILLRSMDYGSTWEIILPGTSENLNDVLICSADLIYICGNNGLLMKSFDLGTTWQAVDLNITANLNHMNLLENENTSRTVNAVVVGDNGTCFGTTNMNNWFTLSLPVTDNVTSVTSSGNTLICSTVNGNILKSTNRGSNWSVIPTGLKLSIVDVVFSSSSTVIGTCGNDTILKSKDKGNSWSLINTQTNYFLYSVDFGSELFGIACGSLGEKIYTYDGGSTWVTNPGTTTAQNFPKDNTAKLDQNYPNPFNPSTIINYTLTDNSTISIKVYDMTGKEVTTLVNTFQSSGSYSVKFDGSRISSGIYFYVMRINNGKEENSITKRMILTK